MSDKSAIEWTDATWNPTRGCTKIAQGCKHCYAETFAERWRGIPGHAYEQGFDPRPAPDQLTIPLHWKKPRRIFVDSMSDLFHETFPFEYITEVFAVMAKAHWHTFQVLTKRPERAVEFLAEYAAGGRHIWPAAQRLEYPKGVHSREVGWPLHHVWIGTSIANQADADKNLTILHQIPAAVHFVSAEPLIEAITFRPRGETLAAMMDLMSRGVADKPDMLGGVDWVIVGGESGPGARPCNVEWIRSIVQQCKAADVPVFVKQIGAHPEGLVRDGDCWNGRLRDRKGGDMSEWPTDLRVRQLPEVPGGEHFE